MPKPPIPESVKDRRVARALAEKAGEVLGAQPSDENIRRIAQEAELYALAQRSSGRERRKADARVAELAASLRAALEQSAAHHDTFSIVLGPECERALAAVEGIAQGLSKKAGPGRPRDTQLRRVCDVVLDAFWEVHKAKIGKLGIYTRRADNTLAGPVLDIVKEALRTAGVRAPSDAAIRDAAKEACQAKFDRPGVGK